MKRSPLMRLLRRRSRFLLVTALLLCATLLLIETLAPPSFPPLSPELADGRPPSPRVRAAVDNAELRRRLLRSVDDSTPTVGTDNDDDSCGETGNDVSVKNRRNSSINKNNSCVAKLRDVIASRPSVFSTSGVDCQALFHGDAAALETALEKTYGNGWNAWKSLWKSRRKESTNRKVTRRHQSSSSSSSSLEDLELMNMTRNCRDYRAARGYFTEPLSRDEAEFPIAFSILMYDNVAQVERLLRSIYMPQNVYCIHIDAKIPSHVQQAMHAIARCFNNVFIASRLESVYWGHISIVYAEMNCMRDLLQYRWKYFVNLSGFMFPLHTNAELVNILRLYDGANDIEGSYIRSDHFWLRVRNHVSWRLTQTFGMFLTVYPKSPAPFNVTIYKGSNQAALTRPFVVYFLYNQQARRLLDWFVDTLAPDEYIWPTLHHNVHLHVPGGYKGDPEVKPFTARASLWQPIADQAHWSWKDWKCHGKWVREICILGTGDLPWLYKRPELFVNKFHAAFEPFAFDCMDELIFNRTISGAVTPGDLTQLLPGAEPAVTFDPTYFLRLPFVANKSELVVSLDEAIGALRR